MEPILERLKGEHLRNWCRFRKELPTFVSRWLFRGPDL